MKNQLRNITAYPQFLFLNVILLFFANILFLVSNTKAEEAVRRISYDTDYDNAKYSNRAYGDFSIEFFQGLGAVHDLPDIDSKFYRFLWTLTHSLVITEIASKYSLVYHEFGHGTRFKAAGVTPEYIVIENFHDTNAINNAQGYDGYFEYLQAFMTSSATGGGARPKSNQTIRTDIKGWNANKFDSLITMGGVNNNMFLAEKIERSIWDGDGHHSFFIPYAINKTSTSDYVIAEKARSFGSGGGDLTYIIKKSYSDQNISLDDLASGSDDAFYMSAITYQLLYGYYDYVANGQKVIRAWNLFGILLPNTNFYINPAGLSKKYSTGYVFNDELVLRIAHESIYKGDHISELSLGFRAKLNQLTIDIEKIGKNHIAIGSYRLTDSLELTTGTAYYHLNSLFGARQIVKISDQLDENTAWIKLSYLY